MNEQQRQNAHYHKIEGREAFRAGVAYEDCPHKHSMYGASHWWEVGWLLEQDKAYRENMEKENNP